MFLYFRLLLSKGSRLYRHWRPHRRTGRYIVYCRGALVVYPTRVGCTAAFRFAAKKTRRANKKPTDVHGAGTRSPFLHKVRLSFGCWHSGIAMASDNAHRPAEGQLDLHSILQRQEPLPRPTPGGAPPASASAQPAGRQIAGPGRRLSPCGLNRSPHDATTPRASRRPARLHCISCKTCAYPLHR